MPAPFKIIVTSDLYTTISGNLFLPMVNVLVFPEYSICNPADNMFFTLKTGTKGPPLADIIYFISAAYFLVLGFTSIQHYRPIYLAPFLFILIMLNEDWIRINIILKTFYSLTTICALCFGSTNIFAKENIRNTLITEIFELDNKACTNIYEFLTTNIVEYETYHKIFASVSVACIVILLVINYPRFKVKPQIDCTKCERWIIWIDLVVMCGLLFGVFKLFFKGFAFM